MFATLHHYRVSCISLAINEEFGHWVKPHSTMWFSHSCWWNTKTPCGSNIFECQRWYLKICNHVYIPCTWLHGACFCCIKNLKSIVWFYTFHLITFLKMCFIQLIPLVYRTQKDINIIFKLFKNIFINLRIHHFIYWHITIHCNYNNVR